MRKNAQLWIEAATRQKKPLKAASSHGVCSCGQSRFNLSYRSGKLIRTCKLCQEEKIV